MIQIMEAGGTLFSCELAGRSIRGCTDTQGERRCPQEPPRYPLSYSDEVAQRLGTANGHINVFSVTPDPKNGVVPSLKGGMDRNGAGFKGN